MLIHRWKGKSNLMRWRRHYYEIDRTLGTGRRIRGECQSTIPEGCRLDPPPVSLYHRPCLRSCHHLLHRLQQSCRFLPTVDQTRYGRRAIHRYDRGPCRPIDCVASVPCTTPGIEHQSHTHPLLIVVKAMDFE